MNVTVEEANGDKVADIGGKVLIGVLIGLILGMFSLAATVISITSNRFTSTDWNTERRILEAEIMSHVTPIHQRDAEQMRDHSQRIRELEQILARHLGGESGGDRQ